MKHERIKGLLLLLTLISMLLMSAVGCAAVLPEGIEQKIINEIDNGQYEAALADLEQMEKFAPVVDMAWVYGERGYIYLQQGKNEAAVEEITKAIEIEPTVSYLMNRGYAYEKLGKYDEAEADYAAAIDLEPNNYRGYEERAGFYLNINKLESALTDIDKAISLAPEEARLYLVRANIRLSMPDPDIEAITADLLKILELEPSGWVREEAIFRLNMLGVEL
jgi:tetratricopeptide (TPR) repeat protein